MPINTTETMGRSHMRVAKTALGLALLGSLLFGGAAAVGASAPAGGLIRVFATPSTNGTGGTVVITGAIGDYGKTLNINQNGKADPNGNYVKITLKKGTFEVNTTTLKAAANNVQPTINPMTCSASFSARAPVTLLDGTGQYTGIAGTVNIIQTFAIILNRFTSGAKKGQCNENNNAQPLALYVSITGAGTVKFS